MQSASMDAKPPLLFYLSTNATQQHTCFTHWSERILSALAKHPWRTKSRSKADVLFLPSLETRFEVNFPLFTGPRLAYILISQSVRYRKSTHRSRFRIVTQNTAHIRQSLMISHRS